MNEQALEKLIAMNCLQSQGSESPLVVTHNRKTIKISRDNNLDVPIDYQNYPTNSAVFIRNLCKGYGNGPPVVDKLCMNVRKGTIYGLLGSSGCGKTTILSCIVGLKKWDSGELLVFGQKPGTPESFIPGKRLGYMPQDLALYDQLSIREMIQFYGRLYNMSRTEVTERWLFLIKLLKLPANFKLVGELSGGQKRRTSLALALIHCPELLILDEPTVGLDPLLRRSIWNHLYKIVSTLNTTVIITTHYIEEAKYSHTVGFMRKGRLLVEGAPTTLLNSFKCDLLEDVILRLCRQDEGTIKDLSNQSPMYTEGNKITFKSSWKKDIAAVISHEELDGIFRKAVGFDCEISENLRRRESRPSESALLRIRNHPLNESFQRVLGMIIVQWLTFMRHPIFVIGLLILPTVHVVLTLALLGVKPKGLNFGIINEELSNWTTECSSPVYDGNVCQFSDLSCKFINEVKKDKIFNLVAYDSVDKALADVHSGNLWGYLSFFGNFSQDTVDVIVSRQFATNESISGSRIPFHLDHSQYINAFLLVKQLIEGYQHYMQELAVSCGIGRAQVEVPMHFRDPVYGTLAEEYTKFIMPGVLVTCLFGMLCFLTCVIFITDLKQGTLSRAHAAGLTTTEVMTSHLLSQAVMALIQLAICTTVMHYGFDFVVEGSMWLYVVFCVLIGLCGSVLGILIGNLCDNVVESLLCGVFGCPILMMLGGVFWPVEGMPHWAQYVGYTLPTTLPVAALKSIIIRGVSFSHLTVWPGFVVLIVWSVLAWIVTILVYKKVN